MASKLFAQLLVSGLQVFSRAFQMALQQGRANAKAGGGAAAATQATRRGNRMSTEEALQVLNVKKSDVTPQSTKAITDIYSRMFEANDPRKGGSFYLQSKIYRAKEAIDFEVQQMLKEASSRTTTKGT
jgi:import inner membrane translocase subunit TIM16